MKKFAVDNIVNFITNRKILSDLKLAMAGPLKRREFVKSTSLASASFAIDGTLLANIFFTGDEKNEIKNAWFIVTFDLKKGTFDISRNNGKPFIGQGSVCANLCSASGGSVIDKHFISSHLYKHSSTSAVFTDAVGTGKKLVILSKDHNKKLNFETHLALYDKLEAVTIEVFCKNVSGKDLILHSIEPIRIIKTEGGTMHVPGISKCITNGEMYYDTGTIHQFGSKNNSITSGNLKGVKLANGPISSQSETIHSWWNAGLFNGYDKESVSLGYLENNFGLGNLLISQIASDEIALIAESVYAPQLVLKPGKILSSNRMMINISENPYRALERYAAAAGTINNARTHSIINGWCSWFYTLSKVSENEVASNAAFASEHLKQYGLEYIQIDEGYQRWHGDWEGNEHFPHGMKWLADTIKSYGLKAGLWIAPYVISAPTEVFQNHPEWLLKNRDGTLKRIGNWEEGAEPPADENPKRYCLDITHPDAAQWLYDLVDTIVNRWGYEMIKIDFMAWSILAADHYNDSTLSAAQVYRKGLEIMRKAAGGKCHILECGPGAITTGLVDSMRIEADVNYGFADTAWETYFLHEASSVSAAAKRYYFHKRTWINDADHICMDLLDHQQAEAAATIIALSGGNMISGDRLSQLDPYKLEILKKITPSFGEAATPVDLFDAEQQSVFAIKIKKSFAEWTVAAFFNPSLTTTAEKKFPLQRLWMDPNKTYIAFDFWKQEFIGEIAGELNVIVQPGSVTLLTLHERTGKPQFLSTDRHVLQGAIETDNVHWVENTKSISGIATGPLHSSYKVFLYVPESHPWTWGGSGLFHDHDDYSAKLVDKNIIRLNVNFEKATQVHWTIQPGKYS